VDFILQAALVSRAVGKPVKVVWSREEDMRHDVYRPATLQRITAGLDRAGKPAAIAHKVVSPSILQYVFPPAVTEDNDPSCLEGLMETHYQIPSQRIDFHLLKIGVPTSVLRTTGYGPNIFAVESFIDELAARARRDPYLLRRDFLKDERALKLLKSMSDTLAQAKTLSFRSRSLVPTAAPNGQWISLSATSRVVGSITRSTRHFPCWI
jgi:isoquinoline 1-oxidoreductase beta subunit